jgi:hypothetical protein
MCNAATQINNAQGFGFEIDVKKFSWEKLKQGREQYIKNITNALQRISHQILHQLQSYHNVLSFFLQ